MKRIYFLALLFLCSLKLFAFDVPKLKARVNDYANIISKEDSVQIENFLEQYENKTGAQIFVLTVPDLNGAPAIEDYSIAVAQKWKAGQKRKDNGVILLIAVAERKVRIEVGYGLEGTLTDADSSRIIRDVIVPSFKNGGYGDGIYNGVRAIVGKLSNDSSLMPVVKKQKKADFVFPLVFFLIIFINMVLRMIFGGRRALRGSGHSTGGGIWFGGFGGGFGSGGGFSGGGGGGFGGGGASGSW